MISLSAEELAKWIIALKIARSQKAEADAEIDSLIKDMQEKLERELGIKSK